MKGERMLLTLGEKFMKYAEEKFPGHDAAALTQQEDFVQDCWGALERKLFMDAMMLVSHKDYPSMKDVKGFVPGEN